VAVIAVPVGWVDRLVKAQVVADGDRDFEGQAVLQADGSLALGAIQLSKVPPASLPWTDPAAVILLVLAVVFAVAVAAVIRKPASLERNTTAPEDDDSLAKKLELPGPPVDP